MIPRFGDANPYLRLLASALEQRGISVSLAKRHGRASLFRAIREHGRPHIVHLHWQHRFLVPRSGSVWQATTSTALFFQQWLALRAIGVRFVWTVHNIVNHERVLERWELQACRLLAKVADAIIVHCPSAVPLVADAYRISPRRISVVPHGHYMDCYPPAVGRSQARRDLGLPADSRIFLFFGQIREYKGLDRLFSAFSKVMDGSSLLIVLGKPKTRALEQSVAGMAATNSNVIARLGHVEDQLLVSYLSACDAVVLPYIGSLTSGSAILAASYGRGLIVPAIGCMKDWPDSAAIRYEPAQPEGLEAALRDALSCDLDTMGEAAKQHAASFEWSEIGEKLDLLYHSTAGGKTSKG